MWFRGSPTRPRLPATILLFTCIGLTAFTALQAVPLPAFLVRILSPATADVWAGALVGRTVRVRFWREQAASIPADAAGRLEWLTRPWQRLDDWLTSLEPGVGRA